MPNDASYERTFSPSLFWSLPSVLVYIYTDWPSQANLKLICIDTVFMIYLSAAGLDVCESLWDFEIPQFILAYTLFYRNQLPIRPNVPGENLWKINS